EVRRTGGGRDLLLDWRESGGPPVEEPTRRGFGSTLLQRVLKVQCGAEIAFAYEPGGLHFHMEVPLPDQRAVPAYEG
ncbi:sensor histidine kinase, partial [Methylobacterium hispanicum]